MVLTFTTAGVTRSATALKASSIAWRTARASIFWPGGFDAGWRLTAPGAAGGVVWADAGRASARKRDSATAIFIGGPSPHFNRPARVYAREKSRISTISWV